MTADELKQRVCDLLDEHAIHYLLIMEVPGDGHEVQTGIFRDGSVNVGLGLCRRAEIELENEVAEGLEDEAGHGEC